MEAANTQRWQCYCKTRTICEHVVDTTFAGGHIFDTTFMYPKIYDITMDYELAKGPNHNITITMMCYVHIMKSQWIMMLLREPIDITINSDVAMYTWNHNGSWDHDVAKGAHYDIAINSDVAMYTLWNRNGSWCC